MTTHTLSQPMNLTAMSAAVGALAPSITTAPAIPVIHSLLDFEEHLALTPQAKRYTLWCLGNKLNSFVIGNIQSHLRAIEREEREVNQAVDRRPDDQEQRDRMAEQDAAIEALAATHAAREQQGFEVATPPIEIAETMVNLRAAIVHKLSIIAMETNTKDSAQTIADSLAYRLRLTPVANESRALRLHLLSGGKIPLDALKKADLTNQIDERQKLLEHAPRIIEIAEELGWKHAAIKDEEIEGMFDSLPAHNRYRLIGGVIQILTAAMAAEVKALIKFGRMDSVTNRTLIEAVLQGYVKFFTAFTRENADELAAYEERGYPLPTLDELLADRV